jgi:hypothetical protein
MLDCLTRAGLLANSYSAQLTAPSNSTPRASLLVRCVNAQVRDGICEVVPYVEAQTPTAAVQEGEL